MKYVKKRVVVEAWQVTDLINRYLTYGIESLPEPVAQAYEDGVIEFPSGLIDHAEPERIDVVTLEGIMQAQHGWWLVRGTHDEFYPVRGDVFDTTYEPIYAATIREKAPHDH